MNTITNVLLALTALSLGGLAFSEEATAPPATKENKAKKAPSGLSEKLKEITLPAISLDEAHLGEVVEFIRFRTADLDPAKKGKGVNFIVDPAILKDDSMTVTMELKNVPVLVALQYICDITETSFVVEEFAVSIIPKDASRKTGTIVTAKKESPAAVKKLIARMDETRLNINLLEASLEESIAYLRLRGKQLGVDSNFVIKGDLGSRIVEKLYLEDVPFSYVLMKVCQFTGTKYQVDESAISIVDAK